MKTLRVPLALLLLTGSLAYAQNAAPGVGSAPENNAPAAVLRSPQELEQLVAPIALYPDALIAIILPATTAPADIVLAARYVRDFPNDRSQIEHRAWDDSVKSLTNYPDVLKWMDDNLQWTKQVGEAFAMQPSDVMQAVQRLRAQARAAGTLVDTPQQQVIAEPEVIRIVPAQPDVIYVPYYEPDVVFVNRPYYYSGPLLTFGVGVPVGSWLAFECDWHRRTIWIGDRHRPWTGHDWHRPLVTYGPTYSGPGFVRTPNVRQWRPPPIPPRSSVTYARQYPSQIVRPAPLNLTNSYAPRNAVTDARRAPPPPSQPVDSSPRTFVPGGHRNGTSSRVSPAPGPAPVAATVPVTVAPAPAATFAPSVVNPTPVQTVTPPPVQRRGGTELSHQRDNRPQSYSYSRAAGSSVAPAVNAPVAVAPSPQYVQPAPTAAPVRSYSHQSHAAPAPNAPVAAPVTRQSAPVVSAPPAQAAPPPQSAPAAPPARSESGSVSRGRRGDDQRER